VLFALLLSSAVTVRGWLHAVWVHVGVEAIRLRWVATIWHHLPWWRIHWIPKLTKHCSTFTCRMAIEHAVALCFRYVHCFLLSFFSPVICFWIGCFVVHYNIVRNILDESAFTSWCRYSINSKLIRYHCKRSQVCQVSLRWFYSFCKLNSLLWRLICNLSCLSVESRYNICTWLINLRSYATCSTSNLVKMSWSQVFLVIIHG
jgi:hypothetical protein